MIFIIIFKNQKIAFLLKMNLNDSYTYIMKRNVTLFSRVVALVLIALYAIQISAQNPIKVGRGSYAEFPPLIHAMEDEHYNDEYCKLYVKEGETRPIPTNDWWSQMLVDMVNMSSYTGVLWPYPQRVVGDKYGSYVDFPSHWNEDVRPGVSGRVLVSDTQLNILGDGFKATHHYVDDWSDWGVVFVLTNEVDKDMKVTIANGIPFTFYEFKGMAPELTFVNEATFFRRDGLERFFPYQGDCFGIKIGNDHYGVYAPNGTVFEKGNGTLSVRFTGDQKFLSIAVLPNAEALDDYYPYAYSKPVDTKVSWSYNEQTGRLSTQYDVTTVNIKGEAENRTIQGFIPHHYRNYGKDYDRGTTVNFAFTNYEYLTPRGQMKMAIGNSFSFGYDFNDVKEVLESVGALEKAVKLNNGFIDRLCNGLSLSEEYKQIIRDARQELSETRNIQVIKPCK